MSKKVSKTVQEILDNLIIGEESETVVNQFSGEAVELEPEAVAVYDYIKGAELSINVLGHTNLIHKFDKMRYYFLDRWPEEYYKLLD